MWHVLLLDTACKCRQILTRSSTFRDADIRGGVNFNWSPPLDVSVTRLWEDATDMTDWTPAFTGGDGTTDVWLCGRDDIDGPDGWSTPFAWDVNDGGDHKCEMDVSSPMLNIRGAVGDDCFAPLATSTDVTNCTKGGCTWLLGATDDKLLYPNIYGSDGPWLNLGLALNNSLMEGETASGSDRSSNSCFSIMAGRECRLVTSNTCALVKPLRVTTGETGDILGDWRIYWANLSGSAVAAPAMHRRQMPKMVDNILHFTESLIYTTDYCQLTSKCVGIKAPTASKCYQECFRIYCSA